MNYGEFLEEQNTECLWVNTLPNNTILIQYNKANEVCKLVNKLKTLDISFSRDESWKYIPSYIFGLNNYTEIKSGDGNDFMHGGCDYSPVAYMFTNNGEYGYSQLTVYMSGAGCSTVLAYEHQYKGGIVIKYFMEK